MTVWAISLPLTRSQWILISIMRSILYKNILHQTCFHNACDRGLRQRLSARDVKFAWTAVLNLGCVHAGRTRLSEDARGMWTWFLIHFTFSYNTIPHWQNNSPLDNIQRINKIINQNANASTASFYWSCSFHTELIVILLIRDLGKWDCWEGWSSF